MASRSFHLEALLSLLRLQHVASAKDLAGEAGASQPTISRLLAEAGPAVVKVGKARSTRYAATRDVRGFGSRWPLYLINGKGRPEDAGELIALHGDGTLFQANPMPAWLRGEFADGLFPGFPWFLEDQRPQGFLGRMFANRHAAELGLNPDIQLWSGDDLMTALLLRGENGPGQFVLGASALERALKAKPDIIPVSERGERYAGMAVAAQSGEQPGSSAGGEQPKFVACVQDEDGEPRHVIVKFTEPVDSHPTARRWADLLIAEHLAGVVLSEHGIASARSDLIFSHGRLCLESTRFDRIGAYGRRGMVSLAAWSDAYDGKRDHWPAAAARMHAGGWLHAQAVADIEQLWWFGRLIGNTDMHFGNLSFFLDDALPLTPCPSYDMLPMVYRPGSGGRLPDQVLEPPPYVPAAMKPWQNAAQWAELLWQRIAEHVDVSPAFRELALANTQAIHGIRQRLG